MNNFTDQKAEAYDFIAWLNSPAVSLDAVFGGVERWQPFRRSHTEAFDDGVGPPGQGLSPGAVEDYLQVGHHAAESPGDSASGNADACSRGNDVLSLGTFVSFRDPVRPGPRDDL